jgi:hypothetical protein
MTRIAIALALTLTLGVAARPAHAHRVIQLDFSNWSLETVFPTINGNTPPTPTDVELVKETIIWELVRNYAPFDVYVTEDFPVFGARSLLRFVPIKGSVLGASGTGTGDCADCTGIGSWDQYQTIAEVYLGGFATQTALSGTNATTARIGRALAHSAAHEIGHNLGLFHCNACDDFFSAGVGTVDATCFPATADQNVTSHVMASGASAGLTNTQRATVDDFFSIHSSRRVLFSNLQPRGHWSRLRDIDADADADLTYGCLEDYDTVEWKNRDSDGAAFESETVFEDDAGNAPDIFLHGDVTGNGKADLVIGKIVDSTTIEWRVRKSTGRAFGSPSLWQAAAGLVGDVFRLGDVDGDGRQDLIAAHPIDPAAILGWSVLVYRSTGTAFASPTASFLTQAQDLVTDWLVADATGDGRDDLIAVHRTDPETNVKIFVSNGSTFSQLDGTNFHPAFQSIEYVHAGDVNGDGLADLVFGDVVGDTAVDWYVALRLLVCVPGSGVPCYQSITAWKTDGSNAGDETHLGDGDGDGRLDLFYGRAVGQDSLVTPPDLDVVKWRARLSTGAAFGGADVWADDAGGDGWLFP